MICAVGSARRQANRSQHRCISATCEGFLEALITRRGVTPAAELVTANHSTGSLRRAFSFLDLMPDWKHLYKTARWKALRQAQLSAHPLCRYCEQMGKVIAATVVDHIEPHKGNHELFHDPDNLQSLCKGCHDRHKQRQEHRGVLAGGDERGFPADPRHHWNR